MRTEIRKINVPIESQSLRLDSYLTRRYPDFSRTEWQQRIAENNIRVNGHVARAARKLNAGDLIEFSYTQRDEPATPTELSVIYADDNYLAINKPAGLPVHPSGIYRTGTVTTQLVEQGIIEDAYLVHRLDRETSGVLILAKNRQAAAAFQRTMRSMQIDKRYLVAVEGSLATMLNAEGYQYRLPNSRLSRRRYFSNANTPANATEIQSCRTIFSPLREHQGMTLVEAQLFTGRMHQIRATLASLGYPIVGDKLYGLDEEFYFRFVDDLLTEEDNRRLRIDRCALHCRLMSLVHPLENTPWRVEADMPADMQSLFPL
jgi:23S rRNA pseudouridine1911/1915/1917 synthase